MPIPFAVIVAAAEIAAKLYTEEQRRKEASQQDAKMLAGFARLLRVCRKTSSQASFPQP